LDGSKYIIIIIIIIIIITIAVVDNVFVVVFVVILLLLQDVQKLTSVLHTYILRTSAQCLWRSCRYWSRRAHVHSCF